MRESLHHPDFHPQSVVHCHAASRYLRPQKNSCGRAAQRSLFRTHVCWRPQSERRPQNKLRKSKRNSWDQEATFFGCVQVVFGFRIDLPSDSLGLRSGFLLPIHLRAFCGLLWSLRGEAHASCKIATVPCRRELFVGRLMQTLSIWFHRHGTKSLAVPPPGCTTDRLTQTPPRGAGSFWLHWPGGRGGSRPS